MASRHSSVGDVTQLSPTCITLHSVLPSLGVYLNSHTHDPASQTLFDIASLQSVFIVQLSPSIPTKTNNHKIETSIQTKYHHIIAGLFQITVFFLLLFHSRNGSLLKILVVLLNVTTYKCFVLHLLVHVYQAISASETFKEAFKELCTR